MFRETRWKQPKINGFDGTVECPRCEYKYAESAHGSSHVTPKLVMLVENIDGKTKTKYICPNCKWAWRP